MATITQVPKNGGWCAPAQRCRANDVIQQTHNRCDHGNGNVFPAIVDRNKNKGPDTNRLLSHHFPVIC